MAEDKALVATTPGTVARQEFGAQQLAVSGETASAAAAATARALVEARFVMAMRRPRDRDDVRAKIMRSIERPGFAGKAGEKSRPGQAWFVKPVGDGVEGFTIRFAEECLQSLGNIDVRTAVTYDDTTKRVVEVAVTDIEANSCLTVSVVVPKTVEKRFLKKGETALSVRMNSKNEPTYLMPATDDEIMQVQNSLISKAVRNEVMRLVPGDIKADARARILEIRFGDAATNPDGVRKEVADAFAKLNVQPSGLRELLGHDLGTATPAELSELRDVYKAIQKGTTTWHAVLSAELAERGEGEPAEKAKPGLDGLTEKLKAEAPKPEPDPTPLPACKHEDCPPSKVAALAPGKTLICRCGEEFRRDA